MKVGLIANPQAGRRTGLSIAESVARLLQQGGWDVDLQPTATPGHGEELAREAAGAGCDLVVGVGGDGTLSELLNGLLGTGVPCGLVPCGTGNDFARFVGINENVAEAAEQLLNGQAVAVDLGRLSNPHRHFINTVGVGFDAAVAERINRRKRISRGLMAYLPAVVAEVAGNSFLPARVEVDGRSFEDEWLLIAVANGNAYGAGFRIAPKAACDDGLLDVILVQRMGRLEVLRSLRLVLRGEHEGHPKVKMLRARKVKIETDQPAPALVDGDVTAQTPLEIEVAPGAGLLWK